jgi:hypothetical protein
MSAGIASESSDRRRELPLLAPSFCQYVNEACDQTFSAPERRRVFFAYAASPAVIASTITDAVAKLREQRRDIDWMPWEVMDPRGQVIFCRICSALRGADVLVADITTLNFNLMFEIGFAIGLGMPVVTIRDTTVTSSTRTFTEIGMLDNIGFVPFRNSDELVAGLADCLDVEALPPLPTREFRDQPIYLLKAPIPVNGSVALGSALKKSRIRYRSFDVAETPRLSMHEARRQVAGSKGVIADLLDPSRDRVVAHNARSALICGMAMAQQKAVLMLQEELSPQTQPLDYRDVVKPYVNAANVPGLMREFLSNVVELMQVDDVGGEDSGINLLADLDLGDVAAENEIAGLRHYFVRTGQAVQARQGHARLVIGRKGAGKTAIFYDVRAAVRRGHERLVVDLKPEGHQFLQLKESLLEKLGTGLQEHTMVAFWHYLLLSELARASLERDRSIARLDPLRSERYDRLQSVYGSHDPGVDLDFSQRLLQQVDRVTRRLGGLSADDVAPRITEVIYSNDYRELNEALREYLRGKEAVWLLVDNLDKGWPIRSATPTDILVVRSLLEATRKLQREFGNQDLEFHCLVFLRSDIYDLLRENTPDKGKDTAIRLDWEDPGVFEQIIMRRLEPSFDGSVDFEAAWNRLCVPLVDGQSSFDYIVDRTLMRPRDLLKFVRHCVDTAMNRGHERIAEDDVAQAERLYSADMLVETAYEIADTHPDLGDVLYAFEGGSPLLGQDEVMDMLGGLIGLDDEAARKTVELLIWFGFFGVQGLGDSEARYGYQVQGNLHRLTWILNSNEASLVIHPAFRSALRCVSS